MNDNDRLKENKRPKREFLLTKVFLALRMAFTFLRGRLPMCVMAIYAEKKQGYISFCVPFRGRDYPLIALGFSQSVFKQFGHRMIELSEDPLIWDNDEPIKITLTERSKE